ncbi:MAG: ribosomal RNA small subunit methyltransferase A [Magnetococcales bacterium]|nr:ribosomal RNA small subunit methyltransferase A [Magnetococcales bacterium]
MVRPQKSLGQNFLSCEASIARIVDGAEIGPAARVVEIGPGLGALTVPLLRRMGKLWAVERDARLIPLLRQRTRDLGELELVYGDALEVSFTELAQERGGTLTLLSNLPFSISTPLLMRVFEERAAFESITVMVQKEVADRLLAEPDTEAYGTLSVYRGLWMHGRIVLQVPRDRFVPAPDVDATVIHLTPRQEPLCPMPTDAALQQVVRAAFGQRRKTLRNALRSLLPESSDLLEEAAIDPMRRGETLSLAEFARLALLWSARRG